MKSNEVKITIFPIEIIKRNKIRFDERIERNSFVRVEQEWREGMENGKRNERYS